MSRGKESTGKELWGQDNGGRGSGPGLPDMFILESVKTVTLGSGTDHSIESSHRENLGGGCELESHASVFLGILSPAQDWQERGFDDIIARAREGMQNKRDYGQDLENPKVERVELGNTFPQLYYFKLLFSL